MTCIATVMLLLILPEYLFWFQIDHCEDIQSMTVMNIPTGYVVHTCGKSYATSTVAVT